MAEFYFTATLSNGRTLFLAPLTERLIAESGQEVSDTSGYFLFERDRSNANHTVQIIAQVVSEEAALQLREMLAMS
jgi:hypothetical protein